MTRTNAESLNRAYRLLPGASLGSFYLPEAHEFVIARGEGSRVWDLEGRAYLDLVMGSGPMVLGHAHPEVVAAVREQIGRGSTFYGMNDVAIELADVIVGASPCAEPVQFSQHRRRGDVLRAAAGARRDRPDEDPQVRGRLPRPSRLRDDERHSRAARRLPGAGAGLRRHPARRRQRRAGGAVQRPRRDHARSSSSTRASSPP